MCKPWHSGIFPAIVWLSLVSAVSVTLDVVEDILLEVPNSFTTEQSMPGHGIEDAIPDVWVLSGSPHGPIAGEYSAFLDASPGITAPFLLLRLKLLVTVVYAPHDLIRPPYPLSLFAFDTVLPFVG